MGTDPGRRFAQFDFPAFEYPTDPALSADRGGQVPQIHRMRIGDRFSIQPLTCKGDKA